MCVYVCIRMCSKVCVHICMCVDVCIICICIGAFQFMCSALRVSACRYVDVCARANETWHSSGDAACKPCRSASIGVDAHVSARIAFVCACRHMQPCTFSVHSDGVCFRRRSRVRYE